MAGASRRDLFGREIPDGFQIVVQRDVLAESLWEYGEDELAQAVLQVSDDELDQIHRLCVWHHVNGPEPEKGPKLTNARVAARAAIEFFERAARDTARLRRRTRPEHERYTAGLSPSGGAPNTPAEGGHLEVRSTGDQ